MKKIIKVSGIGFGLVIVLFCSGCFPLTENASYIGLRNETLCPQRILVSTNQTVAIECVAIYTSPRAEIMDSPRSEEIFRCQKYLLASPEVVLWTVTNQIAADMTAKIARRWEEPSNHNRNYNRSLNQTTEPTNFVKIAGLIYASTNVMSWKLITDSHDRRNATTNNLPVEFGDSVAVYLQQHPKYHAPVLQFQYELDNQTLPVQIPSALSKDSRTYRKWWGYPVQILVIPAVVTDIICSPFYFYETCKAIGEIRG